MNEWSITMTAEILTPGARKAGRVLAWVLLGVLIVSALAAAWVGVRGALAYQHLARIQSEAAESTAAVASDPSAAGAALSSLASDAAAAHDLTSDPVWWLAEQTPWFGPQLSAFGTVAAASDELLRHSLLPLATAAQDVSLDALKPSAGRIDTSALVSIAGPAQEAATRARTATTMVDGIDRTPLLGVGGGGGGPPPTTCSAGSRPL